MRKYLLALLPLFLFGFEPSGHSNTIPTKQFGPGDLQPSATQEKVEVLISQILTQYHYNKVSLNDDLSAKVYENYLKELDGNKWYCVSI